MADGDFKQEDFDRILKLLHNRLTFGLAPVEHPTAFLLGGQAGKLTNMQVFNRNGTVLYEMKATPKVSPKAILRSIINGDNISQTESEDEQMKKDDFQILVQQAREKNILDYFQESGYSIEKKSSNCRR